MNPRPDTLRPVKLRSTRLTTHGQTSVTATKPDILKLHSAYRAGRLYVWGEVNPHKSAARHLPFCEKTVRVARAISHVVDQDRFPAPFHRSTIWIPTLGKNAVSSQDTAAFADAIPRIQPWTISTAVLSAANAFYVLDGANRNPHAESWDTKIAPSTIFWGAALRFAADLALRERFLPTAIADAGNIYARWRPLLNAPDQVRLRNLARAMPPVARAVTPLEADAPPEDDPSALLFDFVAWMIDVFPRIAGKSSRSSAFPMRGFAKQAFEPISLQGAWMLGLRSMESKMSGPRDVLSNFCGQVNEWERPVVRDAEFPWLLSFELQEPASQAAPGTPDAAPGSAERESNAEPGAWRVHYRLEPVYSGASLPTGKASVRHAARLLARAATICADIRPGADSFQLDVTGVFRFLTETAVALGQQGFRVVLPAWWKSRESGGTVHARPVFRAKENKPSSIGGPGMFSLNDLMQFDWEIAIGGENYTREELDRLAESTAPIVMVHGKWLSLDPASIRAALDLWKREPIQARDAIRMALGAVDAPAGIQFEEARGEGGIGDLLRKLGGHSRFEEIPPPAGFHGTLRPYQLRGFSWLGFLRQYGLGACLADDMGLGKTIQALALLEHDRASGIDRPTLLICPTSVVGNWRKEAARFAPGIPVLIHHGQSRKRSEEFVEEASRHALVISSYALTHRDHELLSTVPWAGIILDEAQNIKNPETRQSRALRSLTADYRIALTGTPVENSVGELWSIMDFLNPGLLGNQTEFRRNFLLPIQKRSDPDAVRRLRTLTAPFILRRLKTDSTVIQDLPEKMEMKVFCNLTPEQATLYRRVVDETTRALEAAKGIKRKGVILAALTKLKQVCNHPAQFLKDGSGAAGRSGKLARLTEMVEELLSEGDHALIFSQFVEMGEILQRHLAATFGKEVLFLHGGVQAAKRDKMVERFQKGGPDQATPQLLVLSLKAGGTGLNLTAANHVFHFDRWWNPAVENQATDRAFRIGQRRNVQIHKFVCIGTLEERIDEMIERKKAVADSVIGAGEAWLTELSTDDLRQLFALRQEAVQ
jgi:superfamily II DNA or RNA helicase